jgi:hypothetical protein
VAACPAVIGEQRHRLRPRAGFLDTFLVRQPQLDPQINQNQNKLAAYPKLTIWYLDDAQLAQLSAFADRTMTLSSRYQMVSFGYAASLF